MRNSMENKTFIKTGKKEFDEFIPQVRAFLEKDILDMEIDGRRIRGFRSPDSRAVWIRDHSDMLRGARYFEKDMTSAVSHFAATQAAGGRVFDFFTSFPDQFSGERENWTKYVRIPVEADVEYRFVKAAYLAWQASGDDTWIQGLLPSMEKALHYVINSSQRWDRRLQLVKRAYTIDSWDFAYTAEKSPWLEFQITDDTFWGIMHGDNSGYYEAFRIMGRLYSFFGDADRAGLWNKRAEALRLHMNRTCWNGRFYTHFVKLTPVEIGGVDEKTQLSLSNPMDINRGVASHVMAVSIIREYQERGRRSDAFAEWFSIDPPFPAGIFGDDKLKPGAYVNGGIMPLVGGELAKAAFEHGFEHYGVNILARYFKMIDKDKATYLWYLPDGSPSSRETSTSPDALPTDGWGSSAMLYAFMEGLAGLEDRFKLFQEMRVSPRWVAAGVKEAEVQACYAATGSSISYSYRKTKEKIVLDGEMPKANVRFHVLCPEGELAKRVVVNGKDILFENTLVEKSPYVDFRFFVKDGVVAKIFL